MMAALNKPLTSEASPGVPVPETKRRGSLVHVTSESRLRLTRRPPGSPFFFSSRVSSCLVFRNLRKSQRIRSRLGDSLDPFAPSPVKPRRMHWRTYRRLCALARAAEPIKWAIISALSAGRAHGQRGSRLGARDFSGHLGTAPRQSN
jgi:hypothetical protein